MAHNHLDRQIRPKGTGCESCDLFWERQEARLTARRPTIAVVQQLERMADRPRHAKYPLCTAYYDSPGSDATHTCGNLPGHRGPHRCPGCDLEWT